MMVEFAICAPVFFLLLLAVFEVAYDAYLQEVLDTTVQATARQIQIGVAQPTTRQNMVNNFLCPNGLSFLNCNNLFVRVERLTGAPTCGGGYGVPDIYDATDGRLPVANGHLMLGLYGGSGNAAGPTTCETSTSTSGFCVAGPTTTGPEYIILSAIYVAPTFLGLLVQNTISYGGHTVRAVFSTSAFVTERFTQNTLPNNVVTC